MEIEEQNGQTEAPLIKSQAKQKLNIVVVSDNHANYKRMNKILQMSGDIFIHAGDFTDYGREQNFLEFFQFLDKLKFKHKVVISGNHEIILDNGCIASKQKERYLARFPCSMTKQKVVAELKERCIYLEHQFVQIQGVKIFGSPYSPYYVGNAFQYKLNYEKVIWDAIPKGIDILVTHCPPYGILDQNSEGKHAGSVYLKQVCLQRRPKYHIFGHIHESVGMFKQQGVIFLNVSNEPTRIMI